MKPAGEFREAAEKGQAAREQKTAEEKADMDRVAKLFSTPEGKAVLELLVRRFGVLGRRVRGPQDTDLMVAVRDGEAAAVLFILQCLKSAGVKTLELTL